MAVRAQAKYVRVAPRKAREVVDQIRGKSVDDARSTLFFINRAAARDVAKVLNSAVANAENNNNLVGRRPVRQRGVRRRGSDAQALAVPRHGPRQPHPQAHAATSPSPSSRGRSVPNGSESASRRLPRRRHPRLEVALVHREGVQAVPRRRRRHPHAHPAQAGPRRHLAHHHPQGPEQRHHRHPHRAAGHRDRQERLRGRRAAQRDPRDDAARTSRSTSSRSSVPSSTPCWSRSRSPSSSRTASASVAP